LAPKSRSDETATQGRVDPLRSTPKALYLLPVWDPAMPQSLAQMYLHIVFSTKERRPFLTDTVIRAELHSVLGGLCNSLNCPPVRTGGVADHVHVFCHLGRTITVADLVKELKRESSLWIKTKGSAYADFHWQSGYGAFSVSPWDADTIRDYVANQEEHHRTATFQDEYRGLLTEYGLKWDEHYVWD